MPVTLLVSGVRQVQAARFYPPISSAPALRL